MDRQTLIYIAIAIGAVLIFSVLMQQRSGSSAAPVISLPDAGNNKDAAYYANRIAAVDWKSISDAIGTIFGPKDKKP